MRVLVRSPAMGLVGGSIAPSDGVSITRPCQRMGGRMPYVSKPMKLVTVWFTEEEKAFLDELAKAENVTLSKALREGAQLYFQDATGWIEERRGETGDAKFA